jgi:hypothetical protein
VSGTGLSVEEWTLAHGSSFFRTSGELLVLTFFRFNGFRMEIRLHCSLPSVAKKMDAHEFRKPATVMDCHMENARMTLSHKRQPAVLVAHHHPYASLYQAVILRAVQDLAQNEHQDEAREWLLSPDSDYAFTTAGISPNGIRQQMI